MQHRSPVGSLLLGYGVFQLLGYGVFQFPQGPLRSPRGPYPRENRPAPPVFPPHNPHKVSLFFTSLTLGSGSFTPFPFQLW